MKTGEMVVRVQANNAHGWTLRLVRVPATPPVLSPAKEAELRATGWLPENPTQTRTDR